jgi:uncharacterized membrane protein (UPF0136 family)
MNWHIVVELYIALLLVGGLIGFLKAGSKASLIASTIFAVPLVLALALKWPLNVILITLGVHFLYFAFSFMRNKKVMPGGVMAIASLGAGLFVYFTTKG